MFNVLVFSLAVLDISGNQMNGEIGPGISRLTSLREFIASDNLLTSIDNSCFLIGSLKKCKLNNNPNLVQPPIYEADQGMPRLREYALSTKASFDLLKLAIVGHEGF